MLSSARKKKSQTYAQAAKTVQASQKVSLLHTDIQPNQQVNEKFNTTLRTRIYRAARTEGAFLFDISSCRDKYTDQQAMITLKSQHPNVHACSVLSDVPIRYLEVYIKDDYDDNDILANGLIFEDSKIQTIPCRAVDDAANIIHLKLSHLPMLTKNEVLEGLHKSLPVFGEVLDIGIFSEKVTGFFMGSGYAVINTYQRPDTPNDKKYSVLSHQISWCESKAEVFHATWNNMPTWWRYCHATGHTKFTCEVSKARTLCYSCHQLGHRSAE